MQKAVPVGRLHPRTVLRTLRAQPVELAGGKVCLVETLEAFLSIDPL